MKQKYSGLRDRNGNKIYSGDRVKYSFHSEDQDKVGNVVFEDGCFRAIFHFIPWDCNSSKIKTPLLKDINKECKKYL